MNEEYQDIPNQPDLNLEVRLLTMLAGEAADFERDQLELLIQQRKDVAATYDRLRELHNCLVEVGTGELKGSEDEWRLPAEQRKRLLSVLSCEDAAGEATQPVFAPVFVAAKEQSKWSTLQISKSFIAVASLLLVVGLVWGLSLPAVQMAREATSRVAESAALRAGSSTATSEMSGEFAWRAQETLQAVQPDSYYLYDGVQYSGKDAAGRELSALSEPYRSMDSRTAIDASRYVDGEAAGGLGGYSGGESKADSIADSIAAFDMPAQPFGSSDGLAFPTPSPTTQSAPHTGPENVGGSVGGGGMGMLDSGMSGGAAHLSDLAASNQPSTTWHADFGVPKPGTPARQQESETLSRNGGVALPRIIVTDEKADEGGESVPSIEGKPAIELHMELSSAPEPASEDREFSFGIPFTNRGRFDEATRGQVAAAPESKSEGLALNSSGKEYGDDVWLRFGKPDKSEGLEQVVAATKDKSSVAPTDASEDFDRRSVNGAAMLDTPQKTQRLSELGLAELEETRLAQRSRGLLRAEPEGLDELSATQNSFSTFSLHVSDVSFKLAAAALSQGEWPDASKIRIEEFVNAFDYRDPLPTPAEMVACRMEQAIHPFLMQRNLLRISMRTAATGRSGGTPLRLTLLLDNSGSMERDDRRQTLRRAFEALIQQLTPADSITLLSFANQPRLLADRVPGDQASQLLQIIETLPSEGGTNIEAALQLAMEKANEQRDPAAQHRIVLLTDGAVNLGNANPEKLSALVVKMRDAGVAFDAAGISAQDLNDEVLEALTRQGDGRYYLLDSAEAVSDGFANQLAGALRPSAKNVKVQIEFNPQRVGQYKLLGFEKHRLQTEDFRNDQVDAAEMTAAEAGVAIYQFEARPDGVGDIGSASVRFRDLNSGQMVERTWPIPYESHPPRIEEANPSLRIAAAAALLAAKLKAEPLGASVSLKAVASWLARLPAADRNTTRVGQLQSMVEQARQIRGSEE